MTDCTATTAWRQSIRRALLRVDPQYRADLPTVAAFLAALAPACVARIPVEPLVVTDVALSAATALRVRANFLLYCGWGPTMALQMFRYMMDAYPDLRGYTFDTLALLTREQLIEEFGVFGDVIASALVDPVRNPVFAALIRGQYGEVSLTFVRSSVELVIPLGAPQSPGAVRAAVDAYDYSALQHEIQRVPPLSSDAVADYYYRVTGRKLTTHVHISPNGLEINEAHLQTPQEVRQADHAR